LTLAIDPTGNIDILTKTLGCKRGHLCGRCLLIYTRSAFFGSFWRVAASVPEDSLTSSFKGDLPGGC